ncbi:MAG: Asp-tRNA(Asn)/Glu-tRNA(Gln) amidotransferase subunit GatA [Candidatus Sumerlaeia bacterium]|nr:Asp-tRNA(Asn)/Glu-tRNA(Gln) amidotransferase subunit GatA [Candidatus Sumerlaeia bacterium]
MAIRTAHELARLLAEKQASSRELVEEHLGRIRRLEPRLHAFVSVLEESALAQADASDARRRAGRKLSAFDGVPVAVKDNICTRGVRTTCSSRILENFIPPYNATVVDRLAAAGLVTLGKTNMDEFAMGSSTENSAFGESRNPWDPECVPGGSSGGSAVAVAAGEAPWALGSDTGGSIRQPAALCGIVGVKPTYGMVSRYGLVAFASSLDQIGPMTRDVRDAASLLQLVAGQDRMDSTSAPRAVPDLEAAVEKGSFKGVRIGKPREYFPEEGLDPEVRDAVLRALELARAGGAEIVDVSLPHSPYAVACYYLVATAEASSNLARYDGVQYGYRNQDARNVVDMFSRTRADGFGREVRRRIMMGTYALSAGYFDAYYLKALKVRTLIKRDFEAAFDQCDVILGPTSPTPAFRMGSKTSDPLQMYLCDIFTISLNLAGACGVSLPCGFSSSGLPIGLQLQAKPFAEEALLGAAAAFERALAADTAREPAILSGSA